MEGEYATTTHSACAFDAGEWHPNCTGVVVIAPPGHSHGLLYCPHCRVAADLEACSQKISIESSWYRRKPYGTESAKKEGKGG